MDTTADGWQAAAALEAASRVHQGTSASPAVVTDTARVFLAWLVSEVAAEAAVVLRASFSAYTGNQAQPGVFTKSLITYDSQGDAVAVTIDDAGTGTLTIAPLDSKGDATSDQLTWTQSDTVQGATSPGAAGTVLTITPDATTLNLAVSAVAPGTSTVTATDPNGLTFVEAFQVTPGKVTSLSGTWTPGPEQPAPAP